MTEKPRGHEEDRAYFPNQIPHKVSTIHGQNQEHKQVTKSSERQEQSHTQAQIDSLRQGQRLDAINQKPKHPQIDSLRQGQRLVAIDQKPKHDSSKTEVTLDAVMLEVEGKREKPGARNKADTPQAKLFLLTSATLPK